MWIVRKNVRTETDTFDHKAEELSGVNLQCARRAVSHGYDPVLMLNFEGFIYFDLRRTCAHGSAKL